jgi:hypothetical protein
MKEVMTAENNLTQPRHQPNIMTNSAVMNFLSIKGGANFQISVPDEITRRTSNRQYFSVSQQFQG